MEQLIKVQVQQHSSKKQGIGNAVMGTTFKSIYLGQGRADAQKMK